MFNFKWQFLLNDLVSDITDVVAKFLGEVLKVKRNFGSGRTTTFF